MCVATLTELTQPLQHMKETGDTKTEDLYWGIRTQLQQVSCINDRIMTIKSHIKQVMSESNRDNVATCIDLSNKDVLLPEIVKQNMDELEKMRNKMDQFVTSLEEKAATQAITIEKLQKLLTKTL